MLLYGDHGRIEALGEVQIAEGAAHETRARRHEDLDQPAAPIFLFEPMLLLFPRGIEPLPAREIEEALGRSLHVQDVARPYMAVSVRRGDLLVAPFDVQHRDAIALAPPQLGQRAAVRRRVFRDVQFRDEAADVVPGGEVRGLEAARQQHPARSEQKEQTHGQTDQPQRGDGEHAEGVVPSPHRLAVHYQVGGGPHQGDRPPENRDEGERHQIPRSRLLCLLGEREEHGHEDQHDGGGHEKGGRGTRR